MFTGKCLSCSSLCFTIVQMLWLKKKEKLWCHIIMTGVILLTDSLGKIIVIINLSIIAASSSSPVETKHQSFLLN